MKIVIDIPEEKYKHIQEEQWLPNRLLIEKAIANGTPLDKAIEDIKAEMRMIDASYAYKMWTYDEVARLIDKHLGKESE